MPNYSEELILITGEGLVICHGLELLGHFRASKLDDHLTYESCSDLPKKYPFLLFILVLGGRLDVGHI